PGQRQGAEGELLQPAILELLLEQPVEGEQSGEEGHGPEEARGDPRQKQGLRSDAEGEDRHRQEIEGQSEEGVAALAQHHQQVGVQQAHAAAPAHASAISSSRNSVAADARTSSSASCGVMPPWRAIAAMPPRARCSASAAANSASASSSSA